MTKFFIGIVGAFLLSGCATFGHHANTPTKIEYRVVHPDAAYFTCDRVSLPNPDTLTDVQVSQLINDLVKANKTCANNMNAIKIYLDSAEQVLSDRKDNAN